jgi:hypothetical protein
MLIVTLKNLLRREEMQFDNYELTTIDYTLKYYLEHNQNLDDEDIEWCKLVREKVDSIIISQANYEKECG